MVMNADSGAMLQFSPESLAQRLSQGGEVRKAAVMLRLAEMGPMAEPAIPALIDVLRSESNYLRGYVVIALRKIGFAAIGAVIDVLDDENSQVRYRAAKVLGLIGHNRAVPALTKLLADQDALVQHSAYMALRHIHSPDAQDALKKYFFATKVD
jgi:HEAT repeat protein